MKIMVTGYSGMLGREVHQAVIRMGHHLIIPKVDIAHKIIVQEHGIEVVINCAGLVPQRDPPAFSGELMNVNARGPWNLADWCDQIGARLIHISTDCVFDGAGAGPHLESENPRPVNTYGNSKLAGEVTEDPHLTVRTSFVGFGKRGLIAELKQRVLKDKIYKASDRLLWTGHTAPFIARVLVLLAERKISGILHIPGETLSRYELVSLLNDSLDLGLTILRSPQPIIDRRLSSEYWEKENLPDLPSFKWQLEWLRRSQ